ncbi:hypothetical protein DICSQDRAFT_161922 [Dichomitus squalens LYAD-421 SS1]|uniref:Uncharacterized protein n=1 Tax=Dichomitus squalens (strain LYAD-421) TaxID=732165 RepID=R7T0N8_DICSQ|nr:uncharacterized protein DICSQDRAFT_161922 [Dichomitus squalens LYAD-421 SS1]EJF60732.1 hypothetical protein DICSQDRAFT_161922 [Dichomitus squalens LYAD-421 SS1]
MAGLNTLNPIHALPPTPPSSDVPSIIKAIDSPSILDCELLRRRSSPKVGPLSCAPLDALSSAEIYNASRRLLGILDIIDDPSENHNTNIVAQPPATLETSAPPDPTGQANSHNDPNAIPAPRRPCATPPPPSYTMHIPSVSTQRSHFSSHRFRSRRSPQSTMSFKVAAPVPRVPLASVLSYWGANHARPSPVPGTSVAPADVKMEVDAGEMVHGDRLSKAGLGLLLGLTPSPGPHPRAYPDPHTHTNAQAHAKSQSQSRSRHSRRLRRLAPAALQLTPSTPRRALLTPTSPFTPAPAPVPANMQHTPPSELFANIPLATCQDLSSPFDIDRIPAIPSLDCSQPPSVSPPTDCTPGPSVSSAMAPMSTDPTSLVFPAGDSQNAASYAQTRTHANTDINAATEATADTWHVDLLSWRHTVSRALDSPLSPICVPKSAKCTVHRASLNMAYTVPATPLRASIGELTGSLSQLTPGLPHDTAPPAPPRMGCNPLPELPDHLHSFAPPPPSFSYESSEQAAYPQHADLRFELDTESLALWGEKCSETIARASLSLRSCGLLRDPDSITALCDDLRVAFATVQRALDGTPRDFVMDGSEERQTWYTNHCNVVHSLYRNMHQFYMLARHVEDKPPRIHRLEGILKKLATYQVKFTDLARRVLLSHEKLRLLSLRTELTNARTLARAQAAEERRRRREERTARQEGRMRRYALREEIKRVRGTIRTMRDAAPHLPDENVFRVLDEYEGGDDVDMDGVYDAKWRYNAP